MVVEVFGTADALTRHAALFSATTGGATASGATASRPTARVSEVDDEALAALTETVQPQGLVAVCTQRDVPLADALRKAPQLIAVCADIRDPGNAGTVLRTADAAGATAVIFAGDSVDPYNGKAVRASAGSLFHVDVVRSRSSTAAVAALQDAGLRVLAADGYGESDLFERSDLSEPTAWLFGSEAHGLPDDLKHAADARVRVPILGGAESLNLAAAAAVCLYASAKAMQAKNALKESM
ncbi:RNA methyltransferase [Dactylosporangium cerinum]